MLTSRQLVNADVSVDEFINLFKQEDHYSLKILSVLNVEIRTARKLQ